MLGSPPADRRTAADTTDSGQVAETLLEVIDDPSNSRHADRIMTDFSGDCTFTMARDPEPCGRRVHGKKALGMRWDDVDRYVAATGR